MASIAEQLFSEGMFMGLVEARAERRAEDIIKGKVETLVKVLRHRLGPVPEVVKTQVYALVVSDPDACLDLVLEAESYDEFIPTKESN